MKNSQFYEQEEELLINELIEVQESRISEVLNAEKSPTFDKQVSMNTFTQEVTLPSNNLKDTIEKAINERTSSIGEQFIDQLKSHHSVNIPCNRQSSSQEGKTNEIPISTASPIEKPMTQKPHPKKAIESWQQYQKELSERDKKFYSKLRNRMISHTMAQIKYLDDKKQERRKAREALQSQGGIMQAIRNLFNFSKQDKKITK